MTYQLIHGDCLEVLPTLQAGSIDAVITDPPYGTTACSWDTVIPFDAMWDGIRHVVKPSAAVVLFGSQPFTSALVMSNPQWFRYQWVWHKTIATNFMSLDKQPAKTHEDITVFYKSQPMYSPQMQTGKPYTDNRSRADKKIGIHDTLVSLRKPISNCGTRYPETVVRFSNGNGDTEHPTQKPVELMRYLIRTYTNPGDTVLDFTMGSGSTIVAAIMEGRNAIGIEIDKGYYDIACKRCAEAAAQPRLLDVEPTQPLATQAALLD